MSASTWIERARGQIEIGRPGEQFAARARKEVDYSAEHGSQRARKLLPLLALALIAALGISALRIDLIRTRYAMASVMAEEQLLIEEQRNLIVRRRQLRDPVELAVQARARGFQPLSVVLSLPEPTLAGAAHSPTPMASPSLADASPARRTRSDWR
jgi:hypothetical protein